ncbi:MAG: ISL3 family transposase [Nocardioides sp.]
MSDRTTLLFALPGFRVLDVTLEPAGGRRVLVESIAEEGGCPSCGTLSRLVKDRPTSPVKDLPHGAVPVRVWVRKRRFLCRERLCPRRSFTEVSDELPARARLTTRLRAKVHEAVCTTNRAMSEVGTDYGLAWWTVHRVLVAAAAGTLGPAAPTTTIGIDETRTRSVRWLLDEVGWRRSDPWMTSIVDLDPASAAGIIGLAPGRSGACVQSWLAVQSKEFRDGIEVVAIDPSAPYAAGIRRALPQARIVVDHFHLVMLANQMLTEVRQRVQRVQQGRRGMRVDPAWAHRRLLLRAGDTLGPKSLARLRMVLRTDDPTNEIGAAWAVKELLRQLLAAHGPTRYSRHETAHRRTRFLTACVGADMPETTRLADSVEKWWPEIEGFLELGVTNARTEGYNRVIKQIKRVACGFRNQANYERRIMLHSATNRAA